VAAPDAADISGGTRLEMRSPTLDVPSSGSMPALGSNLGGNEALGAMLPDAPAAQSLPIADQDTTPNGIRSDSHHGQNTTSGIPTQNEEAAAVDVSSLQVGNSTPTSNSPASSPLPLHLAGLPAAEREALQRRRAHELAVSKVAHSYGFYTSPIMQRYLHILVQRAPPSLMHFLFQSFPSLRPSFSQPHNPPHPFPIPLPPS